MKYYFLCKEKYLPYTSNILVVKVNMPAFVSNEYELPIEVDHINELGDLTILATIFLRHLRGFGDLMTNFDIKHLLG